MFPMFRDYNLSPPQRRESKQGKEKENGGGGVGGRGLGDEKSGACASPRTFFSPSPQLQLAFFSPLSPHFPAFGQGSTLTKDERRKTKEASAFQKVKLSEMEGTSRGPV